MDQATLKILLTKYMQGTCSAAELQQIDTWYANLRISHGINKNTVSLFLQQLDSKDNQTTDYEDQMYAAFVSKLQQNAASQNNAEDQIQINKKRKYGWLKIACVIIAALGLSWWFVQILTSRNTSINQTARLADSIQPVNLPGLPGQNRAMLKLANGQTILLDTLQNGIIASQGGIRLVNKAGTLNFSSLTTPATPDNSTANANQLTGQNILQTAAGEQYKLILPDGTKVWLNAASSLEFPASFAHSKTRTVQLEGEAYFEVVHNSQQPFKVQTAHQTIEDIGTAFNVSAYNDDPFTKTTLLEGAVQVSNAASQQQMPKKRTLVPGQQATLPNTDDGNAAIKVISIQTEGAIAWKNGYFQFDGEDIYAIMRRVSRWYKVQVIFDSPVSKSSMEGSMSRFESVSKVLNIIEKTGLFKFRMEGNTIHVSAS